MKDLSGTYFNKLFVVKFLYKIKKNNQWKYYYECRCECGNIIKVEASNLKCGGVKSCGCLKKENHYIKHNLTNHRLYYIWSNLKQRCYNKNTLKYKDYGLRDIIVCDEWIADFMNFYNWAINNGYKEDLTIDRIDVNGNYEPSNCRWATVKEQQNNKRNNHYITYNGETHTLTEWAKKRGINRKTLQTRITMYKWDIEKALNKKVRQ